MEIILLIIIVLQFSYIFYKDYSVDKERERMFLKLMSKDVHEYKNSLIEDNNEDSEKEVNDYIPLEEATVEQVLKAIDKL